MLGGAPGPAPAPLLELRKSTGMPVTMLPEEGTCPLPSLCPTLPDAVTYEGPSHLTTPQTGEEEPKKNKQSEGVKCSSAPGVHASPRTPSACTPAGLGRPLHRDRACDTPRAENFMLWLHHHR